VRTPDLTTTAILMKLYKLTVLVLAVMLMRVSAYAQTSTDAIMMDRQQLCQAIFLTDSRWSNYWEGNLMRSNDNLGTNITESVVYGANYGVTQHFNVQAMLPYVLTRNTQGHLAGQRGLQDLSLSAKYRFYYQRIGTGRLSLLANGAVSTPVSRYSADLLPMSIGMRSRSASTRLIVDYHLDMGLYLWAHGGYTWRDAAQLDRDAYQFDGRVYEGDQAPVPNVLDYFASVGYRQRYWNVAAFYANFTSQSGDDIRRNDMPSVTNRMEGRSAGVFTRFHSKSFGFYLSAQHQFAGRNVGQATTLQGGVLYMFYVKKRNPISTEK
jgi:hypothetical protein